MFKTTKILAVINNNHILVKKSNILIILTFLTINYIVSLNNDCKI